MDAAVSNEIRGIREILTYVRPFVPEEWFERREDAKVWVSAYRVYGVPSVRSFATRPLVADLEQVRVVFLYWNAPYPRLYHNLIERKGELSALTDEQARRFFAASSESRWRYCYVVAVRTGLRPGELLGLRWQDLDLDSDPGSLRVRRTPDTHSTPTFNPPKSEAARRTVALHWEAQDALQAQRAMLAAEGLPVGQKALVFPSTKGTPMSADNLRKRDLKPDLARAGLPELTLHELRHTFASIMLHE